MFVSIFLTFLFLQLSKLQPLKITIKANTFVEQNLSEKPAKKI